ncbi:MAG: hypothetical protein KGL55_14430 [Rhodospirillales bacterium]|nr:hypothetical protein [Rhodospirillales bacterium]
MMAALPAAAQTQAPSGVLALPPKVPAHPAPPPTPPRAAPVAPVQRVAPLSSPSELGHSVPGHAPPAHPAVAHPAAHKAVRRPPVVHAVQNSHAQRPPPSRSASAKPAPAKTVLAHPVAGRATASPAGASSATARPAGPSAAAVVAAPSAPAPTEPSKGAVTGLALPRWAALRSGDVNLRRGPGMRYPVEWVYHRRGLPVEIEREFDVWRLVRDQDGVEGWVHQATLIDQRAFVVKGAAATLRAAPSATAGAVALLEPGVVGHVRACAAGQGWCRMQVGNYRGWLPRAAVWGVSATEAVN